MNFWIMLWQTLFFSALGLFAIVSVWVTIQGARDIKHLMAILNKRHEEGP